MPHLNRRGRDSLKPRSASLRRRWQVFFLETNFPYALLLLATCVGIMIGWRAFQPDLFPELWTEMGGMTLDVLFILIIFAFFEHRRSRRQFVERQRETIDDYKRWDNPEALFRIVGAIRRLNRVFVHAIDLSGIRMTGFYFPEHGIRRLTGSRFDDNREAELFRRLTIIRDVGFDGVDCERVIFSECDRCASWPNSHRHVRLADCGFSECNLRNAKFDGALLEWSEKPPKSHYQSRGPDDEEGTQSSWGPFFRADISGASFRGCKFVNADFRDVIGLHSADFFRATGLESAEFDEHYEWAWAQENARRAE